MSETRGETIANLDDVAALLQAAQSVVVVTGAGVSAESGIPTFRDAMEGHWSRFDPRELATPEAFAENPARVTQWYDERRLAALECEPNAGHHALARIEAACLARGADFVVLTQNVDRLHQRAGSQHVVEVHGSIMRWRCTRTGERFDELPTPFPSYPPPSPAGGLLRPDVVWFGEALPEHALAAATEALRGCDLYFAIGTSGVVWPVAGFVLTAKAAGAATVEVNLTDTDATYEFGRTLRGPSGVVLPALAEAAFGPA